MYTGHVGLALGAQSFRRSLPLWLVLIAAQAPDWLDAGMCIVGSGRGPHGLFTHGLIPVAATAVGFGVVALTLTRDPRGAGIVTAVVLSHYALDYITGLKPTWAGGPVVGLDIYARPFLDVLLESATVIVGWLLYRRSFPREVRNSGPVNAIAILLLIVQIAAGAALALNTTGHVKC